MLIAQLSDLHFLREGILAFGKLDMHAHTARCVQAVKALDPAPDAVLITGDLTHDGDLETYQDLAEMLSELDQSVFPIPGNHDDRALIRAVFPEIQALSPSGPVCYAIDQGPLRLIALDSAVDGKPYGELGETQRAWLSRTLNADKDRPVLVMLHHPPFKTGIGHMDWSMLRDADSLAEIIGEHGHVERVLCGHAHRPVQTRFAGTIAQIAPGVAHQVKLLLGEGRGPWIMEPPAFLLHHWHEDDGLITHQVLIGDFSLEGGFGDPHAGEPLD
jgi:3',5'-cyclic AMP phosphodiesterase CpdA